MEDIMNIGDKVRIKVSQEAGEVIGLAFYAESAPSALVRYCAGDGRAVQDWWNISALEKDLLAQ